MADIELLKYASNVELNRQSLIKHCEDNNIVINKNASLTEVVSANNSINLSADQTKHKVEWVDIDGKVLKTIYVDHGSDITNEPAPQVEYLNEYLDFVEWRTDADLDNIICDSYLVAFYKVKDDSEGRNCTIIRCYIDDDSGYDFKISYYWSNNGQTLYVDWGDGNTDTTVASGSSISITHTFAVKGFYDIKVYGGSTITQQYFNTNSGSPIGGSLNANRAIYAIYFGNKIYKINDYTLFRAPQLNVLVFNEGITSIGGNAFSGMGNLAVACFSNSITTFGSYIFTDPYKLKYLVTSKNSAAYPGTTKCSIETLLIPNHITTLNSRCIMNDDDLKQVVFKPTRTNACSINNQYVFYGCGNLKELTVPEGTTSFSSTESNASGIGVKKLTLPSTIISTKMDLTAMKDLEEIIINKPQLDFGFKLYTKSITLENWLYLAQKLQDRSSMNPLNLDLSGSYHILFETIKVTEYGLPTEDENAMTLYKYITQVKNWTITYQYNY